MISFIPPPKAQRILAENARTKRLRMEFTQVGLAERSGVPLATLRKFEKTGAISLKSFLKLQMILGNLEDILNATKEKEEEFLTIDDVLAANEKEANAPKETIFPTREKRSLHHLLHLTSHKF